MAQVELESREETNYLGEVETATDYIVFEPMHYNQIYKVRVSKETHKGYMKEYIPLANGNFNIKVGVGRKSAKKLEKLEQYLSRNKEELAEAWKAGKYQFIVNTICQDVVAEKII